MKKWSFTLFAILTVAFIIGAMLYQSGNLGGGPKTPPGEQAAATAAPPAGEQAWLRLETAPYPQVYTAVGAIRSQEEITIISRLPSARVTAVHFRSGEAFKAGDLLIALDERDLKAMADAAAENLNGAESRLQFAEGEYERHRKLFEAQAVSARVYEETASTYNAIKAEVAMLKYTLINARTNLDFATLRAPFDGIVAELQCEPGDLATPLNPLMKIFNPAKLQLRVPLREGLFRHVHIGDPLQVKVESTGRSFAAAVKEIIPAVDAGSRSFMINASLAGDTAGLMPGMFAVCDIPTGSRQLLAVPAGSIRRAGQLEWVLLRGGNGQVRRQLVKTAPLTADRVEIIAGVRAGDEILEKQP